MTSSEYAGIYSHIFQQVAAAQCIFYQNTIDPAGPHLP